MARVEKSTKARQKTAEAASPLHEIVGDDVYDVWVAMLKGLVPDGRTHRLSVLVASMLAYASNVAWSNARRGTIPVHAEVARSTNAAADGLVD